MAPTRPEAQKPSAISSRQVRLSARIPGGAPSEAGDGRGSSRGRSEPEAAAGEPDERPVTVRIPSEGTDALNRILKRPADSSSAPAQRQIKIDSNNSGAATAQKPAPTTPAASTLKKLTLNERFSKLSKSPTPATGAQSDSRPAVVLLGGVEGGQRKRPSSGAGEWMGSHSSLEVGPSSDEALPYIGVLKRPRIIATPRSIASNVSASAASGVGVSVGVASPGVIRLGTVRNAVNSINQRKQPDELPVDRVVHINSDGVLGGGSGARVRPLEARIGGLSPLRVPKTPLGGRLGLSPSARRELAHNLQQVSSPRLRLALGGLGGAGASSASAPPTARYESSITIGRLNVLHGADGSVRTIKLAGGGGGSVASSPMSASSAAAARLRARARVSFGGVTTYSPRTPAASSIRRRLGYQRPLGGTPNPLSGRLGDSFSRNSFK